MRPLLEAVDDHAVRQVVGRKRHCDFVAQDDANAVFAHAAAELCANGTCFGFNFKLAASEHLGHYSVQLYVIIVAQKGLRFAGLAPRAPF